MRTTAHLLILGGALALLIACARPAHLQPHSPMPQPHTTLATAAAIGPATYNPQVMMDAANALLPLGKDLLLDAFDAQLARERADFASFGLFVLLRILFETPADGVHPPMRIGAPDVDPPADPAALPAFPIVWAEGVPFNLVSGYMLGGHPEHMAAHVAHVREHGRLRTQPIHTGDKAKCMAALQAQWQAAMGREVPEQVRIRLQSQVASLR